MALVVCVVFLRPAPAAADFTICNHISYGLKVAVAADWPDVYYESFHYETNYGHMTSGWTMIAAGACKDLIPYNIYDLAVYFYAYAPSDSATKMGGQYKRCLDLKHNFAYGESLAEHERILLSCGGFYTNCANVPYGPQTAGKYRARPPCTVGAEYGMFTVDHQGDGNWIETLTK